MAEQYGKIIGFKGRAAEVEVLQSEACAHCQLCDMGAKRLHVVEIENTAGAGLGDIVLLASPARELMLASFVAWLLPLLAVLAGIGAGYFFAGFVWPDGRETAAAIMGLVMLFPGYLLVKKGGTLFGNGKMLSPVMVRVVGIHEPGVKNLASCEKTTTK